MKKASGRFSLLVTLFLSGTLLSCKRPEEKPVFKDAPVVLISIDTLRSDRLPAYGYKKIETPHLDQFEKDAWLFERAYSPCPMTLPSHVTMLTGTLPPEHGVRNNIGFVFDGNAHESLPRILKRQGYATAAAVSSYVLRYGTGMGNLFDEYEDSVGVTAGVQSVNFQRKGDVTAAFANAWIEKNAARPFFYFFHIYEPHVPYDPPEPFRSKYGLTYDAEVASADAIVGGLLAHMKKLGVYERAIVIVTSDHGEGLGDHGEEQHSIFLYREAIQVPLLIKFPKNHEAGKRIAVPVQLSDLVPTVLEALGLPKQEKTSGVSLMGEEKAAPARVIYSETLFPRLQLGWSDLRSVLDERYHYIHGPRPELYDLVADPAEKNDLMKTSRDTAARLLRELRRFPEGNEKPQSVDQETAKRLASLGYMGSLRERGDSGELPNPADNLPSLRAMEEAWHLTSQGKRPEAIEVLFKSVKANPAMFDAWVKLAELLSESGRDDEASAAYEKALGMSPVFYADISVALGTVKLRLQKLDEAEGLARKALPEIPAKARELLANVALARGNLVTAEKETRAALESRNPQPSALLLLAEVKIRAGRPGEALQLVEQAAAKTQGGSLPPVFNLEYLRGDALARMNRLTEAETAFRAEIAAFPAHAEPYASLAILGFLKGDQKGVESLLEEMVRQNPSPRSYRLAEKTLETLGQQKDAARWRNRASTESKSPSYSNSLSR